MNRFNPRPSPIAKKARPPSRFAALLNFVIRHGGSVSVDPVHMLPLDSPRPSPRRY